MTNQKGARGGESAEDAGQIREAGRSALGEGGSGSDGDWHVEVRRHPGRAGRALRTAGTVAVVVAALVAVAVANAPQDTAPTSAPVVVVRESVTVEKVAAPAVVVVTETELVASLGAAPTDVAYLQAARGVVARTNLNGLADADLIALGQSFCQAITDGATAADFTKSASLMVVPLRTYRSLLSLSEITYCPQHIGFRI